MELLQGAESEVDYCNLDIPNVPRPLDFIRRYASFSDDDSLIKMNHGTTTLAFKFSKGIVVAVDSRSTGGPIVKSHTVKKVIEINKYLLGTMAGGAADCSYWEELLGMRCRLYELRNKRRISVAAASKLLCNMIFNYRGMGLSMGTMIVGWDNSGPNIYYVDDSCVRLKGDIFSVGSGSTFAYGVLDNEYKYEMDIECAIELGKKSIYHASHRDAYSGGSVNVYLVQEDGWKFMGNEDFSILHEKYTKEVST